MGCGGSLANVMFFVGALDVTDVRTFDLVCELQCVYVVCVLRLMYLVSLDFRSVCRFVCVCGCVVGCVCVFLRLASPNWFGLAT